MTCGPASLATLCDYWKVPATHAEITDAICYDGTFDHAERKWGESQGMVVREFRVEPKCARELIRRGVPFTLTTPELSSSHLQVVTGFDEWRDTLLVRDPGGRHYTEYAWEPFLERYAPTGPRGMVMLPRAELHRLEGCVLPDCEEYDQLYAINRALDEGRREEAGELLAAMRKRDEDHFLTLFARRAVAWYDGNPAEQLEAVRALREKFPTDPRLLLAELNALRTEGTQGERRALLEATYRRNDSDPVFWRDYAAELVSDGATCALGIRILRRALRAAPDDAHALWHLGNAWWNENRREDAFMVYRLAACSADKLELLANSYFIAARHLHRTDEALSFLRDRFDRHGAKSSYPAMTLFDALNRLDRTGEVHDVLEEAMKRRPEDGELLLFAAERKAWAGRLPESVELLQRARGKSPLPYWLRTAAKLARLRNDTAECLRLWEELLEYQPLAMDALGQIAELKAAAEGPRAALTFLSKKSGENAYHLDLYQERLRWLDHVADPEGAIAVLRAMLAVDAKYAWARREIALRLLPMGKLDLALEEARIARSLQPEVPSSWTVLGDVYDRLGETEEARECFRRALRLEVDNGYAISRLVELESTHAARLAALDFIHGEIVRQPLFGAGLDAYRKAAFDHLPPETLLRQLTAARDARPDLWDAWYVLLEQLSAMERSAEALEVAREMERLFPLVPGTWIQLGNCLLHSGKAGEAAEAYQRALELDHGWSAAALKLAEAQQHCGRLEDARATLEQARNRDPLNARVHGNLAIVLWRLGFHEEGFHSMEEAARLQPGLRWTWETLWQWSHVLGSVGRLVALEQIK